ncbi:MAG TPA: FHA domain-containing protein, partial [Labilithrix sp.]|nr:FHA domain-containing protein [Labilithrix sp.]
ELRLKAPGDQRFLLDVAKLHLAWRRPGAAATSMRGHDVTVEIAAREPAPLAEAVRRVMLVRSDRVRQEARGLADRGLFGAAALLLRDLLAQIKAAPGFVVGEASPLGEAYELIVDEAMAMERNPDRAAYEMFRKSTVGSMLAVRAPGPASSRGVASSKLLEVTAGKYPEAFLVVMNGQAVGQRHLLKEECVIGRTASADLALGSDGVSRRHAEVYALEGEFWACDLGSTNVTKVNGKPLGSAPVKLRSGDVLLVGDVELSYVEKG